LAPPPEDPWSFSDNSAFLSAFLNIQNALPVELQAFQQTDNGHLIAKGFVVEGSSNRIVALTTIKGNIL
jgi:hypothetical protein